MILICVFLFTTNVEAQKRAVTENGEEILLFDDGTWKYENEEDQVAIEIPMNPTHFRKSENSKFLLKSNKINLGIWLDPKKWKFSKATDNPDAEYEIQLKDGDLYAMIITEKVEIPLETLRNIALENGKGVSPDLRIVKEEYRMVNDIKVLLLQMDGTMQGIKFSFYGYYYSNEKGTVQFITYSSQSLLIEYQKYCDELLNGIVLLGE